MGELTERDHRRHVRVFSVSAQLMKPVVRLLFHYRWEPVPDIDGPLFVLCNHNTDLDCVLLGVAAPKCLYFVAAENVSRMGLLGKLVMRGFDPILHHKGVQGTGSTREILSRIKSGYSVALFPEGNRSFNAQTCPIPPATGKVARISGATLVTYRLTGGYFTTPRWGKGIRKGRVEGRVAGIYSPEQLKAMSPDEVAAAIERDLWTDAYEEQAKKPVRFHSRRRAEYLESMLFLCPKCGRIGTLHSKGNGISCDCGNRMILTEYGFLRDANGAEYTITELDAAQRLRLQEIADAAGKACLFSDAVTFREVDGTHKVCAEAQITLAAFSDRFTAGERSIPMEAVDGISILQRNLLILHTAGSSTYYEFSGPPNFNALKYLYLFRIHHPSVNGTL